MYEKKSTFILYMEAHSITLVGGGKRKKKKHSAQPSGSSRFNTNDEDYDQVTPPFDGTPVGTTRYVTARNMLYRSIDAQTGPRGGGGSSTRICVGPFFEMVGWRYN